MAVVLFLCNSKHFFLERCIYESSQQTVFALHVYAFFIYLVMWYMHIDILI